MNSSARTTRSRRWTAVVVGGAATGAVLLGGGIALADGSGGDTAPGSSTPSGAPAPADDRLVGTVTAVSGESMTLTDDTGTSHDVALTDETRYGGPGGPGSGGPGSGGPGSGGPGGPAGGPGAGGPAPTAPADGSAPTAPTDGTAPAAPSEGTGPAPSDGSAPAAPSDEPAPAPADGTAPAAPSEGSAPAPADGTAPAAPSEGSGPEAGSLDDIAVGDRVEVRVSDGTALAVREVQATVDGTVVSVDGTDLTVVTTPGLRVDVDAAALSALPAVGDDVHLHGTVSQDGHTVVADDSDTGPR